MPPSTKPASMLVVKIPSETSLGLNDRDFCNVSITSIDEDGKVVEGNPVVEFIPTGPLGTLKGGLLHLADHRGILSKDEIGKITQGDTEEKINHKRTGLRFPLVL